MKLDFKKVGAYFKRKETKSEQKPLRNPYRDWAIIFTMSVVCFIIAILWSVYLFWGIQQGTIFSSPESTATSTKKINPENFSNALELITKRQQNFDELKKSRPTVTDPMI